MQINWKLRAKNPTFWIGLIGIFLSVIGVSPESLTSWDAVGNMLLTFIQNPVAMVSVVMAFIGVFTDPTTSGISDSSLAMTYNSPKKDAE